MALSTYTELKASIADWLFGRSDLTSQIPDFITMAEARFNRVIRCNDMDTSATLTITSGAATVPTGLLSIRSIYLNETPYGKIMFKPSDMIDQADPAITDKPRYYSRVGESFTFWPRTSADARIRYRASIDPLATAAGGTNWLLAKHPDLYLVASLVSAAAYLKEDDRLPVWISQANDMIEGINIDDRMEQEDGMQVQPSSHVV
jgi:hypothetical protein